jgi:anti-anti-sigma factor
MQTILETNTLKQDIVAIKVRGRIDVTTAEQLEQIINSMLQSNRSEIIFDLSEVEYICSRGWGVFLSNLKRARDSGGDLKLAKMKPDVYDVYKVLEFFWFLRSYTSLDDAVFDFEHKIPPMP